MPMTSVSEAERIILQYAKPFPVETVSLGKAVGRVLREAMINDRDQPPFNKVLMDGIALNFDSWQKGVREFLIDETIPAGVNPKPLKGPNKCVRIMTGAVVPKGCDCVVPVEQVHIEGDHAKLKDWTVIRKNQNIRFQGSDGKRGQVLLKAGCRLWATHVGVAASVGKSKIKVSYMPKVAVVSTGDELVDIHQMPKPFQTRMSNSYALQALLTQAQLGEVAIFHVRDDRKTMLKVLKDILSKFDVLVLSGGVSAGEFDYVPGVLKQLGVKEVFHKVSQKPGKPMWFGAKKNKVVFGLPGNPVSTQMCAYRYVIPFLKKASGLDVKRETIAVVDQIKIQSDLTHFLPVSGGRVVSTGGSGDFGALAQADGFIEYDSAKNQTAWPYFSWRV